MDLKSVQRHDTAEITIRDWNGNPTDMTVTVYGADSDQYRNAWAELSRKYKGTDDHTNLERGAKLIQLCIESWQNVESDDKAIDPHSDEALQILMNRDFDWFNEQILSAIKRRSLFFSGPASD